MMAPFQYFANKIGERIQDEQSDIKAAGGIFSIAKRQKDPFVKSMDEAMEFTQLNNKRLAELAAVLPGNTQEYIEVSKRISDSVSRIVVNNKAAAVEFANELRRERGAEALTGEGRKATQGAITELLGEMTKKTVLAGLGTGGGGPGGMAGAYGLPGLTERMLTQDEVSMGQFQRYAAIFRDPLIMDALSRFIPKINATTAGTLDRFKILNRLFDEVLPPEMIRKFERSTAGILEAFNTSIFGPETGLFGLGRKMGGLGKRMDDFGNYIKVLDDGTMVAVKSLEEASNIDLSLFDMLRDIFANLSITLYPIISNLPLIFDPLKKIGNLLVDARHLTGRFLYSFEAYKKGLQDMVKGMSESEQLEFNKVSIDLRASLAAINNMFRKFGVIDIKQFQENAQKIMSTEFDAGAMIKGFFNTFINSKVAKDIGKTVGLVIGTVLSEVAGVMKQFMGLTKASGLVEGLKEGFNQAGGVKAIKEIISMIFQGLFNLVLTVIKTAPFESAMIAGLFMLPSVIAGTISSAVTAVFTGGLPKLKEAFMKMIANMLRVKPVTVKDLGVTTPITDPRRMLPAARQTKALPTGAMAAADDVAKAGWFAKMVNNLKNFSKMLISPIKAFGKLNIALAVLTGVIEFATALFSGEDFAGALGKAAGPVVGSIIGGALLGPLGAVVGGMIGSLKPITDFFSESFRSIGGALQGFGDSLVMIGTLIGDVFGEIFGGLSGLATAISGTEVQLDALKIILAPITLALQALEVGLKGFALLLAEMRVFFKRFFGSSAEYQDAIKERDKLNASMKESQGRINAYNDSMLGTAALQKRVNDAQYELINGGKKLTEARKKELVAYIESAKKLNEEVKTKKEAKVQQAAKTAEQSKPAAAAEKPTTPKVIPTTKPVVGDKIQADLRARAAQDIAWFWKQLTTPPKQPAKPKKAPVGERLDKDLASIFTPKDNQKTAQNTTQINQKAAQQLNATNAAKTSTDATKNAVVAQKASLNTIQSTLSSIFALLASGGLRVQTQQQSPNIFINGQLQKNGGLGDLPFDTTQTDPNKPSSIFNWAKGGLGDAIASEMRMKPPGSDLVIANSSETVIPAAGGNEGGMLGFVAAFRDGLNLVANVIRQTSQQTDTKLSAGFQTLVTGYKMAQERQVSAINRINSTLVSNQQQTNARLAKLETKFTTPMMPGGLGGAGAGGVDAFTPIAQRYGLQMTSGYRPGDPGWHGANRARDFSNGTGPTPQMMQFAQYLASTYGSNLKELIYTPLGFSIKNGQRVPPYAQGSHYNHVHVAYALGLNDGRMFTSMDAARGWEKSMVPGSVKVASITGNSGERLGETNIVNNMTVTQQPGEDGEALANRVATLFFDAVKNAQSSSIFA
jgi:hypothetical protein